MVHRLTHRLENTFYKQSYILPESFSNQVRIIVGTLRMVGEGKVKPKDMLAILKGCDRKLAGPTAPANGLYFVGAKY